MSNLNNILNKKTQIIAEVSANHAGSKSQFLEHILIAKRSGADFVKIQTYEADDMCLNKKFKIKKGIWKNLNLYNLYKKAQTPYDWHYDAFKLAKKNKIKLFSTPFSIKSYKFLKKFKPPFYKIASFEITDLNLIENIAKERIPIILSTGIANINEIKNAVNTIKKFHSEIILLYCVSGYPTPSSEINFDNFEYLKKETGVKHVGFSDHTKGIKVTLKALKYNICLIEKHFIINKRIKSPDSLFSINPTELKNLKKKIINKKNLNKFFHYPLNHKKKITPSERRSLIFRRSIFVTKDIQKNEKFTSKNISCYRPKIGICASKYKKIIGMRANVRIKSQTCLKMVHIK